jgi:hypothetical protein
MRYKVILEIEEYVEATSAKRAKQQFKDSLEWADINYGTYHVEPQWRFAMEYECPCGEAWSMEHDCACNDRCPSCDRENEPVSVEDA